MSVVLIFCLVALCVYFVQSKFGLFVLGWQLAGPWSMPLVGNVQMIKSLRPEYLFLTIAKYRRRYGRTFRLWLGTQLWVFLHSPEETRDALNDPSLRKADTFQQLGVLIGNGLLISHGKYWDAHRRVLGPAFHPKVLNGFTEAIAQHALRFVEKLRAREGEAVEVSDFLFPCVLDAIVDTSMGKQLNAQDDPNNIYTQAFHSASAALFQRMVNPLLAFDFVFERTTLHERLQRSLAVIHELMESVIRERAERLQREGTEEGANVEREEEEQAGRRRRTLLDTLLTAEIDGRPLTFREIRDEVNTFVFAGVDTTTAAMSFVLYALAKHAEEQARVRQEIEAVQREADGALSVADIHGLTYLDMFIKECLRFYTIVPLTGRQTTSETRIGGRRYGPGVTLWIDMYGLAHDEAFFERPDEFRPERFGREEQPTLPPFAYIPFSGGPHVCIGRKYALLIMKILTVHVLRRFDIAARNPGEELVLMSQMVLKSLHGIHLCFRPRQ